MPAGAAEAGAGARSGPLLGALAHLPRRESEAPPDAAWIAAALSFGEKAAGAAAVMGAADPWGAADAWRS